MLVRLCAHSGVQLSNVCLYISVRALLPLCPPLFPRSLPVCPVSSLTFPFFLLSHFTLFLPFSSPCVFPSTRPNRSPNNSPLFQSLTCMSIKLSTETLSLRRIKHTSLLKTRCNITNERRTTLSCFACYSFSLLSSPCLVLCFHPSASVSFQLRSRKDNPADDAGCTLCSFSEGESQVPQERDCTSSTNEAWGDPNAA